MSIVLTLQLYKPSWQVLLQKKVHLDFRDGEVIVLIGYPDEWQIHKESIHHFNFASELLPLEFRRKAKAWQRIKTVDSWLEHLTTREREVIFYRYINHDFEASKVIDEVNHGLIYKTLSEYEIASRLKISRSTVRIYIQRAFEKIQSLVGLDNVAQNIV